MSMPSGKKNERTWSASSSDDEDFVHPPVHALSKKTLSEEEQENQSTSWCLYDESCCPNALPTDVLNEGSFSSTILVYVNGKRYLLENPNPEYTLSDFLRTQLKLTGTRIGCNEGGCGGCIVMVSHFDHQKGTIVNRSVNACLFPLIAADGCQIITVEGVGSSRNDMLHLIQQRLKDFHASQCGFCTPGFVMSLYALLRNNPRPSLEEIEQSMDGNLCRCTGYRPILEAASTFSCGKEDCCQKNAKSSDCEKKCTDDNCCQKDVSTEPELIGQAHPLFPFELRNYKFKPLRVNNEQSISHNNRPLTWYRPTSLSQTLQIVKAHKNQLKRFVVGNSEIAIEVRMKNKHYPCVIQPTHIPELVKMNTSYDEKTGEATQISIGGSVTISQLGDFIKERVETLPAYQTSGLKCILDQIKYFASTPIRNSACIAGNIITASPASDLNPLWVAMDCKIRILTSDNIINTVNFKDFFLGYRSVQLKQSEVMVDLIIPLPRACEKGCTQIVRCFKQSKRREDDIAIVTAAMLIKFNDETKTVKDCAFSFGGMNAYTVSAEKTRKFLIGRQFDQATFDESIKYMNEDLPLGSTAPGGMVEYRRSLVLGFYFKFFIYVTKNMALRELTAEEQGSLFDRYYVDRTYPKGNQYYKTIEIGTSVGKPVRHNYAHLQVSGEAKFTDDILPVFGEAYAAFVYSTKPLAKILSVNTEKALAMTGVIGYADHRDVKGCNVVGAVVKDEELFISNECTSVGQVIGVIIAETSLQAKLAAKEVIVEYGPSESKPIFTIQEAIKNNSYLVKEKKISSGNAKEVIEKLRQNSEFLVHSGDLYFGGQEHFYIEPTTALVIPKSPEEGEYTIWASSQSPSHTQMTIAEVLHVPSHRVKVSVKRIGGGFGGKETKPAYVAAALAVAADKFERPVRIALEREADMASTGQRHPFYFKYTVAINRKTLMFEAMDIEMCSNGGFSMDMSESVLYRALQCVDNCYHIPNTHIIGRVCKTNTQSNTAFRGFGGPQGCLAMEYIIESCSSELATLEMTQSEISLRIREYNMYKPSQAITPFKMVIEDIDRVHRLWEQVKETSNYSQRVEEIREFNSKSRYRKKGIAIIPVKYGVAFGVKFLNQGGALIQVYSNDGSVLLSHGGTCMGQGLHIKVMQCTASALGIPIELIHITETSTASVPNTSPTAASMSADLYGQAAINACKKLNKRLLELKKKLFPELFTNLQNYKDDEPPSLTIDQWKQLVNEAYFQGETSLSATGFFHSEDVWMDWEKGEGKPFSYFTYGAAASEVEIDTLTGDWSCLRTDIVMDVGNSINPAIDIGQIEGAMVQGMGLFTMEELIWGDDAHPWVAPGNLFTRGPGSYKIPSANDIPCEFNVHLLKDSLNPYATYSSKAIGEPPLFLGSTVYFAIRNAVESARNDFGLKGTFHFDSPATTERIRMSCQDRFTQEFVQDANFRVKGSF